MQELGIRPRSFNYENTCFAFSATVSLPCGVGGNLSRYIYQAQHTLEEE